ncbi:MAG: glycosyltransferase family 2 protein [Parcubacteria group bacterium]|nr:glycosyltransferase family 2 protein [Parcubacteria group bacterium]
MKVVVVMPAYNAEATLEKTFRDIPFDYVDEIILVDDASKDKTVELANKIKDNYKNKPFTIVVHTKNKGYGGNQKKCYDLALNNGADIIIMLHPDYQYDPKLVKYFREFIENGYFDVMLGSRIRGRQEALRGGMPLYKYFANRFLTFIENIVSGRNLSEWHTGMRAYKREVLNNIDYSSFSDDFVFDTQMLFRIVEKGYSIGEIPVPVRYFEDSSSINFSRSLKYGLVTLWETFKFLNRKFFYRTRNISKI